MNFANDTYIFTALFAINFIIMGIASTMCVYSEISFKSITRKPLIIVAFGALFSLAAIIITNSLSEITTNSLIFTLSLFSLILVIVSIIRRRSYINHSFNLETEENTQTRTFRALIILCLISLVGMNIPPFSILPLWFGLCIPFIMFLPGYLLVNVILPKNDEITFLERSSISVFLSLVITSSIGLILIQIENMLNMRHVSVVLVFLTLLVLIPYYYLKSRKIDPNVRYNYEKINKVLFIITVIAVIAVIGSGIFCSTQDFMQGNTTFIINGVGGSPDSDGYYNFTDGTNLTISMKITNEEYETMNYRETIEVYNNTTNKVLSEYKQTIKNEESITIPTTIQMTPGRKEIRFTLYDENNNPYKVRHLFVNVNSEES